MIDMITCPNCQRKLNLPPECEGQEVQCPSCKTQFRAMPAPPRQPTALPTPPVPSLTVHAEEVDPGTWPPPSPRRSRPRAGASVGLPTRPSKASNGKFLFLLPVGGIVLMACLCGVIRSLDRRDHAVVHNAPNFGFKQQPAPQKDWVGKDWLPGGGPVFVPREPDAQLNAQVTRDLAPLFKGLADTLAAGDAQRMASYLNPERTVDELMVQGMFADNMAINRPQVTQRLAGEMSAVLQAEFPRWQTSQVVQAQHLGQGDMVVAVRHTRTDGTPVKMRWG